MDDRARAGRAACSTRSRSAGSRAGGGRARPGRGGGRPAAGAARSRRPTCSWCMTRLWDGGERAGSRATAAGDAGALGGAEQIVPHPPGRGACALPAGPAGGRRGVFHYLVTPSGHEDRATPRPTSPTTSELPEDPRSGGAREALPARRAHPAAGADRRRARPGAAASRSSTTCSPRRSSAGGPSGRPGGRPRRPPIASSSSGPGAGGAARAWPRCWSPWWWPWGRGWPPGPCWPPGPGRRPPRRRRRRCARTRRHGQRHGGQVKRDAYIAQADTICTKGWARRQGAGLPPRPPREDAQAHARWLKGKVGIGQRTLRQWRDLPVPAPIDPKVAPVLDQF